MALYESSLNSLKRIGKGKVRDIYAVDDDKMLIVASDRLSAFDVVLPDPIPDKGACSPSSSNFWFDKLGHVVPNHLTGIDPETVVKGEDERAQVRGRAIVVQKLKPLPIEAVVRGYLIGSGWKDYQADRRGLRHPLPPGLQTGAEAARADLHAGDQGRERPRREHLLRRAWARSSARTSRSKVRDISLRLYTEAAEFAATTRHHHRRHQVRVRPERQNDSAS